MKTQRDAGILDSDFVAAIRQAIETLSRRDYPNVSLTADFVGMSVRTLQRRLAHAGVSHHMLVAQTRFATAAAVLKRTDAKILDLALDLRYSDHANFTRAFGRWAGCSPRQYQSRQAPRRWIAKRRRGDNPEFPSAAAGFRSEPVAGSCAYADPRTQPMTNAEALRIANAQSEFFPAAVRHAAMATLQPEKRLMLAVLEHAMEDFRTYAFVATGRGRWLFMEVDAWFRSAATGLFDFEGICQATGLEPDCVRKCLRNWYDAAASADRFDSRAAQG